jgi:hypothetical protein
MNLEEILSARSNYYKFISKGSRKKLIVIFSGIGFIETCQDYLNDDRNIFDEIDAGLFPESFNVDFYRSLKDSDYLDEFDYIFFADAKKKAYLQGIPGIGNDPMEIYRFLSGLVWENQYSEVYFMGTCVGAFQSLYQASLFYQYHEKHYGFSVPQTTLKKIKVLSFNGFTDLENCAFYNHHIKPDLLDANETVHPVYISAIPGLRKKFLTPSVQLEFIVDASPLYQHEIDVIRTQFSDIKVHRYETVTHNIGRYLKDKGLLKSVIHSFLTH